MLKRAIILLAIVSVCLIGQGALAQQASDPSFECLSGPGPLEVISGFYDDKFKPDVAPGKRFDARGANFEIPGIISHSLVSLEDSGDNNSMCWAGGYFTTSLSWHGLDVSWDQSKHGTDGDGGVMNNTTSATSYEDRMTWTGLHVFNMHDGIRTSNSESNWTIQHTWLDYIRDDCVENDHIYSGKIYDSLFDGCYSGISVRPSSSGHGDGQGKTITLDRVLVRMEPMPYPYKWNSKDDPLLYVEGYGDVPFGYGKVFKLDKGNEPDFRITNSVFLLEYDAGKTIFPPKAKVRVCNNNTVIWLGEPCDAPNFLLDDFPGCFTIITDRDQGRSLWEDRVADWHARHPGVGANRKPAEPGDYSWPRYAQEGSTPSPTVEPPPLSLECVPTAPTFTIEPAVSQHVTAGTLVTYTVSIGNEDGPECAGSCYRLTAKTPEGWETAFAAESQFVEPGTSVSTTLKIKSSLSAAGGAYPFDITAQIVDDPGYAASASLTYVVSQKSRNRAPSVVDDSAATPKGTSSACFISTVSVDTSWQSK